MFPGFVRVVGELACRAPRSAPAPSRLDRGPHRLLALGWQGEPRGGDAGGTQDVCVRKRRSSWLTVARAAAGRVAPGRDAAPVPAAIAPADGQPGVSRRRAARPNPPAAPVGANRPPVAASPRGAGPRRLAAQESPVPTTTMPGRAAGQRPAASPRLGASPPAAAGQPPAASLGRSRRARVALVGANRPPDLDPSARPVMTGVHAVPPAVEGPQQLAGGPARRREDARRRRDTARGKAVLSAALSRWPEVEPNEAIAGRGVETRDLRNSTRPSCPRFWQPRCYPGM